MNKFTPIRNQFKVSNISLSQEWVYENIKKIPKIESNKLLSRTYVNTVYVELENIKS